ncbi:MAG: nucleotide exchange factor GrpE [Candidatus Liptonbacteria bacterium]|nr:nucleotide exchange factor GrpE [Candidatus Liptonbacteria bacterium]
MDNKEQPQAAAPPQSPQDEARAELTEKLSLCERERDEYLNGWRRAKADFVNYKNEEFKRLEEVIKFGNEDIVRDVIAVLDSLDRGSAALEAAGEKEAASGMRRIQGQLEEMMKRRGLERMMVRPGDAFDPARHEAIAEVPAGAPPGAVAEELECGYLLNGRVVRAAKVNLSKTVQNN